MMCPRLFLRLVTSGGSEAPQMSDPTGLPGSKRDVEVPMSPADSNEPVPVCSVEPGTHTDVNTNPTSS